MCQKLNNILPSIYVISLKTKQEFIKSQIYQSLSKITNRIILSKGIILNKKQQRYYYYYPKSSIGITLAHNKVWKNISKNVKINNNNFSLIFEDDAFLNEKYTYDSFWDLINKICHNNNFDIYKLHSDFDNGFTSLAAYIINNNSIDKLLNNYKIILGQPDFDLFVLSLFNKNIKILNHYENVFNTDESISTNRIEKYSFLNLLKDIKLSKRSDKNLKNILQYKVLRILNYETIAFEIILFVFLIISLFLKNKYLFLIITILYIL